jgi:hypothetical protein
MEDQLGIWLRTRLDIQLLHETNRLAEFADISMYWPGGEEGEIMDLMYDSHDHRWEDFGNRQHRSHRYLVSCATRILLYARFLRRPANYYSFLTSYGSTKTELPK